MYHDHQFEHKAVPNVPRGFAEWGLGEVAYVKLEDIGGNRVHVVRAANGEGLGAAETHELAAAMVLQNGMIAVHVH